MLELRTYQREALDAVFDFWNRGGENPLVTIGTGLGKSLLAASIIQKLISDYPDIRILCVTHVKELIQQNYLELLTIWPFAPAGIYSAGLGRREANTQIVFAGIQTVHRKARKIGHVDLVIVDEAHLIPRSSATMYGKFFGDLHSINPDMKVAGLTATDFRTDSGSLTEGDVRMFDEVVYEYGIGDGIKDGYLAPLVTKATTTAFDLDGVARRGGDYVPGALQAACDKTEITKRAVDEIVAHGRDRRSWLAFCSGVEHARHVRDEIRSRGFSCETITGDTPSAERVRFLERFKAGDIRCLTNNSVLTTGLNVPSIDMLCMLRPTLSAGLFVQMVGRGSRLAPGKESCLVLDFARLTHRHGPVDLVKAKTPGKGDGEAPIKECPECHSLVPISVMTCPDCGHEFPPPDKVKIEARASSAPILSIQVVVPQWMDVRSRTFKYHEKVGGTPSVRAEYMQSNFTLQRDWICIQHTGYPRERAQQYWKQHSGNMPYPKTVDEFLDRQAELCQTKQIQIKADGKYWKVCGVRPVKPGELLTSKLDLSDVPF